MERLMPKDRYIHKRLEMGCWHEANYPKGVACVCLICKKVFKDNPTYSSGEWIPKLIKRLVELGRWKDVEFYFEKQYLWEESLVGLVFRFDKYTAWWCQQPRFRDLLYDYLTNVA